MFKVDLQNFYKIVGCLHVYSDISQLLLQYLIL